MLYILYGRDDFSLNQAVDKIKADLGDREMVATSTTILEGRHLTLNELRNKCGVAPFLSSYRLVIVDGLLGRFEGEAKQTTVRQAQIDKRAGGMGRPGLLHQANAGNNCDSVD